VGRSAAAGAEWIVDAVEAGDLGIEHVHLVSAEDPTKRKTLSVRALADPSCNGLRRCNLSGAFLLLDHLCSSSK
jgi:hypothetical protein